MIHKRQIIVEEFAAEVAPRVRQDFGIALICRIPMIDMISKLFHVINALLTNKHSSTFETYLAESFLMLSFHVHAQKIDTPVPFPISTTPYRAGQNSQAHSFSSV